MWYWHDDNLVTVMLGGDWMLRYLLAAAAAAMMIAGSASAATVVFSDDFDGYASGNVLNVGANFFAPNWTTTPTLDYIVDNSYGNLCRGTGACVDLDGSTGNSGLLSTMMSFAAGTYEIAYQLFGSARGDTNTVTITLGDQSLVLSNIASGADVSGVWTVTTGAVGALSFQNAGGDNIGAVLSSVSVAAVPLPAGGFLLIGAIGALAALRRRKAA